MRMLLLGLLLSIGCAHGQTAATPAGCVTGAVASEGREGPVSAVLKRPDGSVVFLEGPLTAEVLSLTGALVTVCGEVGREARGSLVATSWELRQIDGLQAYAGVMERRGTGYALAPGGSRPLVPLTDVPSEFNEKVGAMAWVAGTWVGGAFAVKSFGWMPLSPTAPNRSTQVNKEI